MATYRQIMTTSVTSAGTIVIDITSIPDSFTDLILHASLRDNGSNNNFVTLFNSDTSSVYYQRTMWAENTNHLSLQNSNTSRTNIYADAITDSTHISNAFNSYTLYIPRYTYNANKTCFIESVSENDTAAKGIRNMIAAKWAVTSPITSIQLKQAASGFATNSTVSLYGISTSI